MNEGRLTDQLATQVLGWRPSSDRYLKPGRGWIPRWRFRPLQELTDAFRLLDTGVQQYTLTRDSRGFSAEVQIGSRRGSASGINKARTITLAVARALGLEADK